RNADTPIARRETRGVTPAVDALSSSFDADELDRLVHEGLEKTQRIRAPADARIHASRQLSLALEDLRARLDADDRLEVRHELGERMRSTGRAQHVVRGIHVRGPVSKGFVDRVLEDPRAGRD